MLLLLTTEQWPVMIYQCAGEYAWKNIASETALIDIDKLGQVFEFDNGTKQIRDHYDLYDPIKGRILGVADREINIKTTWDPADIQRWNKCQHQDTMGRGTHR